jgi:hypothetical protein
MGLHLISRPELQGHQNRTSTSGKGARGVSKEDSVDVYECHLRVRSMAHWMLRRELGKLKCRLGFIPVLKLANINLNTTICTHTHRRLVNEYGSTYGAEV